MKIRGQKGLQYSITFFKEGDESSEFMRLTSGLKESSANKNKDDDDENLPFPYIITPPEPPGDLKVVPQSEVHSPRKVKDTKEEFNCQYCGMKLTKEERFSHNCRKSPE